MPMQYVEHTLAGTRLGTKSPVSFQFDWTPPATAAGNITIYVAGNATNGDNSVLGDHPYFQQYTLTLNAPFPSNPVDLERGERGQFRPGHLLRRVGHDHRIESCQ